MSVVVSVLSYHHFTLTPLDWRRRKKKKNSIWFKVPIQCPHFLGLGLVMNSGTGDRVWSWVLQHCRYISLSNSFRPSSCLCLDSRLTLFWFQSLLNQLRSWPGLGLKLCNTCSVTNIHRVLPHSRNCNLDVWGLVTLIVDLEQSTFLRIASETY